MPPTNTSAPPPQPPVPAHGDGQAGSVDAIPPSQADESQTEQQKSAPEPPTEGRKRRREEDAQQVKEPLIPISSSDEEMDYQVSIHCATCCLPQAIPTIHHFAHTPYMTVHNHDVTQESGKELCMF